MQLEARHVRQVHDAVLAALGRDAIVSIAIFGSVARGEQVASSDLDVMVRARSPLSFADRARLEEAFEASDLPFVADIVCYHRVEPGLRRAMLVGSLAVGV